MLALLHSGSATTEENGAVFGVATHYFVSLKKRNGQEWNLLNARNGLRVNAQQFHVICVNSAICRLEAKYFEANFVKVFGGFNCED